MNNMNGDGRSNNMRSPLWILTFFFILLALPALACSVPDLPNIPFIQPDSIAPDLSSTPAGDTITYLQHTPSTWIRAKRSPVRE